MLWQYIFLGIIQGIFEWLPISSEGITAIFSRFLIKDFNPIDLALFLHLSTLLVAIIYFWKDWWEIIRFKDKKLFSFLFISTAISLIIGFPLYKMAKNATLGSGLLSVMGCGLLVTAYFHKKNIIWNKGEKYLALIVGFLQGLAVIPGLSRSGATIFGLSLGKTEPEKILKISYLMSVPIVFASTFYLFLQDSGLVLNSWPALITAFFTGILTLHFLIKLSKKIDFFKFALFFGFICFVGFFLELIF